MTVRKSFPGLLPQEWYGETKNRPGTRIRICFGQQFPSPSIPSIPWMSYKRRLLELSPISFGIWRTPNWTVSDQTSWPAIIGNSYSSGFTTNPEEMEEGVDSTRMSWKSTKLVEIKSSKFTPTRIVWRGYYTEQWTVCQTLLPITIGNNCPSGFITHPERVGVGVDSSGRLERVESW